ncbi:hypothetical protein NS14008_23975 [Nocardia seriolae]|nr:hypothetical protein NS14008_23975 [Nocardia seriolae]
MTNPHEDKVVRVWLEPMGEDYWMRPREAFTFEFDEREFSASMCGAHFDVSWDDGDLIVWAGAIAKVRDQSGTELECGHQRPPVD